MNARDATIVARLTAERRDVVQRLARLNAMTAAITTRVTVGTVEMPVTMPQRRTIIRELIVDANLAIASIDRELAQLGITVAATIPAPDEAPYYLKD